MLRSVKREFYNNSFEDNKNNAREIWKTIKILTGSKRSAQQIQITSLRVDGRGVDDATEMADQLKLHFSTMFISRLALTRSLALVFCVLLLLQLQRVLPD